MPEEFFSRLRDYARDAPHIESVIIAGSYARGTNRENSDIDVIIITSNKSGMIADEGFARAFGAVCKQQTEYYGACTSVRVWYKDGTEAEFGIVDPSWISVPLDAGTYRVLSDGYKIVADKKGHFKHLSL